MNATVKRTIFGVLFLAVMLGGLLFHEIPFAILFAFIAAVMLHEYYRMTMGEAYKGLQFSAILAGLLLFVWTNRLCHNAVSLGSVPAVLLFLMLVLMVESVLDGAGKDFMKTAFLYAGLLYIGLPLALSNAVVFHGGEFSGLLMVAYFCIIWASDVGAYCFGMLLGQKVWPAKMCPKISPKKSWAGFFGGLLLAMLAGAILHWTGLLAAPMLHCLVMAALMHVTGVFGDLFESLWKRAAGIKDSGNVIPGHGGLMDRFDSALFAIPTGYLYLVLFELL